MSTPKTSVNKQSNNKSVNPLFKTFKILKGQTIKTKNTAELVEYIRGNGTNCQFVSLLTHTEPKLKVGCEHRGNILKVSRRNGLINVNYEKSVAKKVAEALGLPENTIDYEGGETWFKHETKDGKALPIVVHATKNNGEYYLQYFPMNSSGHKYVTKDTFQEIPEETLKPYFYAESEKSDLKPTTCVFNIKNIKEIKVAGVVIKG